MNFYDFEFLVNDSNKPTTLGAAFGQTKMMTEENVTNQNMSQPKNEQAENRESQNQSNQFSVVAKQDLSDVEKLVMNSTTIEKIFSKLYK